MLIVLFFSLQLSPAEDSQFGDDLATPLASAVRLLISTSAGLVKAADIRNQRMRDMLSQTTTTQ